MLAADREHGQALIATLQLPLAGTLELPLARHFFGWRPGRGEDRFAELHLGSVPAWGGSARLVRRDRSRPVGRQVIPAGQDGVRFGSARSRLGDRGVAQRRTANVRPTRRPNSRPSPESPWPMLRMPGLLSREDTRGIAGCRACGVSTRRSGSPDMIEGLTAFMEKRIPVFNRDQQQ